MPLPSHQKQKEVKPHRKEERVQKKPDMPRRGGRKKRGVMKEDIVKEVVVKGRCPMQMRWVFCVVVVSFVVVITVVVVVAIERKRQPEVSCKKQNSPSTEKEKRKAKEGDPGPHEAKEERRCRARGNPKSLLALSLLGSAHPTASSADSLRTRYNRAPLFIPKDVNAKVFASLSVQELKHHILLLRGTFFSDQPKHLHGRDRPIATLGLLVGFLITLTDERIVDDEIRLDVSPVMRARVVMAILSAIVLLANRALRLWLVRVKSTITDIAAEVILIGVTVLMPLAVLGAGKALRAQREFALVQFSICFELLPAFWAGVEERFRLFVGQEGQLGGVGQGNAFADRATLVGFGHLAAFLGEAGARGATVG
jgi:hypothetical protein